MFDIYRKMGHYAPRAMHCELMVNDEYMGIFVFTEKIKRDKNRIDIPRMDENDNSGDGLTGGYIFKIDYTDDELTWVSQHNPNGYPDGSVEFIYSYPDATHITKQQKTYLKNHIDTFEDVLFGDNFADSATGYRAYISVDAFVDYFIISELSRNIDAYKKSCTFYKEADSRGGLIYPGPVWDFDWAMKNIKNTVYDHIDGSGWVYQTKPGESWPVTPAWMPRLMEDPYFASKVGMRYVELRKTILSKTALYHYIDSVENVLNVAQQRHFQKWPVLGQNTGTPESDYIPGTFSGEVKKIKYWISLRLSWLDRNMPQQSEPVEKTDVDDE
jgi:hypothetical protein